MSFSSKSPSWGFRERSSAPLSSSRGDPLHSLIRETIIAAITSNLSSVHQPHQLLIDISTADGAASGRDG